MVGTGHGPARILTERMLLRRYEPGDAAAVKEAIDSSLDHLRAFMNWAWEAPESLEVVEERLIMFGELFDRGDELVYGVFSRDESEYLGGAGLHRPRTSPRAVEIGYWIRASRVRRGLATELSAALTRVALTYCRVQQVEIHVDPANIASLGVPAKLGYRLEATLPGVLVPIREGGPARDAAVYVLRAEDFASSPVAGMPPPSYPS